MLIDSTRGASRRNSPCRSVRKLAELIDEVRLLLIDSLHVRIRIVDVREVFGRVDCLVEPVAGSGRQWVAFYRLLATA